MVMDSPVKKIIRRMDDRGFPLLVILSFIIAIVCSTHRATWFAITGGLMVVWFLVCIIDFDNPNQKDTKSMTPALVGLFRFAYVFTIMSVVLLLAPLAIGDAAIAVQGGKVSGIGFFRGCLATQNEKASSQRTVDSIGSSLIPPCDQGQQASQTGKEKEAAAGGSASSPSEASGAAQAGRADSHLWLLSIGGVSGKVEYADKSTVDASKPDDTSKGKSEKKPEIVAVHVHDGLVIPLYVILVSIMGAAVSLSRRLPEYQRRAALGDAEHALLTHDEAKEKVVFELMQLISAPLIVVAAFAAVTPRSPGVAIVLAFATGFASESILCLIRSVTDGIRPAGSTKPSPTDAGHPGKVPVVVTDARGNTVSGLAVTVKEHPSVKATTDKSGEATLVIPVGPATIIVTTPGGVAFPHTLTVTSGNNQVRKIEV